MVSARSRFKVQTRPNDPSLNALDAKAIACDTSGDMAITTPNMVFVPEPHNEDEALRARADGRFGVVDCFQWPQEWARQFEYAVCIPRKEYHGEPDAIASAWYTPVEADFHITQASPFPVGKLKADKAAAILKLHEIIKLRYDTWKRPRGDKTDIASKLLQSLEYTCTLLDSFPLPYRDVVVCVAQAQRYFLDIYAFLEYCEVVLPRRSFPDPISHPVRSDWMGCFTSETKLCNELFQAGVPVWLIRFSHTITEDTIIHNLVTYTSPDHVVRAEFRQAGQKVAPFETIYQGPGGFDRHLNTRRSYKESAPSTAPYLIDQQVPSHVGRVQKKGQSRKAREKAQRGPSQGVTAPQTRDKWSDPNVPEMPAPFPAWDQAIKRVRRDSASTKSGQVDPGYRVPEPVLLLSSQSAERRKLYLTNWLSVRSSWIKWLGESPPERYPSPQLWRDYLGGILVREPKDQSPEEISRPTTGRAKRSAKSRHADALQIFAELSNLAQGGLWAGKEVSWYDKTLLITSLSDPPVLLLRAVLWEMYEIGFRYELWALDHAIVRDKWTRFQCERVDMFRMIFAGTKGIDRWMDTLPVKAGTLGFTDADHDNIAVLRSFCVLLNTWPDAPPALGDFAIHYCEEDDPQKVRVHAITYQACAFYTQCFYDFFGRPPLVPHAFPFEYHDA